MNWLIYAVCGVAGGIFGWYAGADGSPGVPFGGKESGSALWEPRIRSRGAGERESAVPAGSRESFVADPDAFFAWLGRLSPLDRNSVVSGLLSDDDLLFAPALLKSPTIADLPDDLILATIQRCMRQDVEAFSDALKSAMRQPSKLTDVFLENPVMPTGFQDWYHLAEPMEIYLEAIASGKGFRNDELTKSMLSAMMAMGDAFPAANLAKSGFVPTGPTAALVAGLMGAAYPDGFERLPADAPPEVREAFVAAAARAGAALPSLEGREAGIRDRGLLDGAIRRDGLQQEGIERLRDFVPTATKEDVAILAEAAVTSQCDPAALLELLSGDPSFDPLAAEVVRRVAGTDPVEASAVLATLTDPPDAAILSLVSEIRDDPEAALLWATQLRDPNELRRLATELLPELEATDPQRAAELRMQINGGTPR